MPLLLGIVIFTLPFNGLYGQDGFGYIQYAHAWLDFFRDSPTVDPGFITWPPIYALLAAIFNYVFQIDIGLFYQLISLIFLGFGAHVMFRTLDYRSLLSKQERLIYIAFFFLISPYILRQSTLVMSDMMGIGFIALVYYHLSRWQLGQRKGLLLMFGFASLAVMTRYGAFFVVFIPCIVGLVLALQRKAISTLLTAIAIGLAATIPLWIMRMGSDLVFLSHPFLQDWDFLNVFRSSFLLDKGVKNFTLPNGLFVSSLLWHPGNMLLGVVLLPFYPLIFKKRDSMILICLASVVVYLIFLAGTPFQNQRYLLLALPPLLILLQPAFKGLVDFVGRFQLAKRLLPIAGIALGGVSIAFTLYSFRSIWYFNQQEIELSEYFEELPPSTIYSYGMDVSISYYVPKHTYLSYHEEKHQQAMYQTGDLVLFNKQLMIDTWQNIPCAQAWERLSGLDNLVVMKEFEDGWTLYRIEDR